MWTIGDIKAQGKAAFKANYWRSVLVAFILALFYGGAAASGANNSGGESGTPLEALQQQWYALSQEEQIVLVVSVLGALSVVILISLLLKVFVFNPLKVGCVDFFTENVEDAPASLSAVKTGFSHYGRTFLTLFLTDFFLCLWALLLVVPAIIKAYSYRMVPYILAEHPELSPTEIITRSREMMNGHKWNAFLYDLSFIGWYLLSALTLGLVGIFWSRPYKENADAALYLALR